MASNRAKDASLQTFYADAQSFLKRLKRNNNKEWFDQNRRDYESVVRDPAKLFAEQVRAGLADQLEQKMQAKVFRINRDLRFSKDKTPYKPHIHIAFSPVMTGGKPAGAALFFGLETNYLTLGRRPLLT